MCGQDLTWSQLLLHYRDNHNAVMDVRLYRCQACGIDFNNKNLRQNHQNLAHRHKTTYSCEKCGKQFKGGKSKRKLEQHMEKVHMKDSQKRQCQFCKSWFTTPESLGNHVRRLHTGETPSKCTYCEESFFSSQDLYSHKKLVHPCSYDADRKRKAWLRENPGKDPSEYKMDCHLCGTLWTNITELRQHWHEAHPDQIDMPEKREHTQVTCERCGKGWQSSSGATHLKIHTFEIHDLEATRCPICLDEFSDRGEAMKHVAEGHKKYHQFKKEAMCEHCGHVASSEFNLATHMRAHSGLFSRPTSCTYCRKEFPRYVSMARHRKIAHREQYAVDREPWLPDGYS